MLELPRRISAAIVADVGIDVRHVIDIGSGPGVYLARFLHAFPEARGTWTDASAAMLGLAREQLRDLADRVTFELVDAERLSGAKLAQADVIVTSRVLHHFSRESLARLYRVVYELLMPGGFFFNLDHIGAPGDWERVYRGVRTRLIGERAKPLAAHRHEYPLATLDDHLSWARAAGFADTDAPWRTLYTALILARR
jgi:SAM-dependent methyltransferase